MAYALESTSVIIRNYVRETDLEECRALMRELTAWHHEMYQRPTLGGRTQRMTEISKLWIQACYGLLSIVPKS